LQNAANRSNERTKSAGKCGQICGDLISHAERPQVKLALQLSP
jgi:hypothetical protein